MGRTSEAAGPSREAMTVQDEHEREPGSDGAEDPLDAGIEVGGAGGGGERPTAESRPNEDAPLRAREHWGQGPSGPSPYADSGSSEVARARRQSGNEDPGE
jgi:hypothetical protein